MRNQQFEVGQKVTCVIGSNRGSKFIIEDVLKDSYSCTMVGDESGKRYGFNDNHLREVLEYKVIRDSEGKYYNARLDKFQDHFHFDCLRDKSFVDLMMQYMDNCTVESYELVEVQEGER